MPEAPPTDAQARAARIVSGRVMRLDAKVCHVDVKGEVRLCATRGKLFENLGNVKNPVTVGDWVDVDPTGDPQSIEAVQPRRNQLSRVASAHDPREQVLFANVDHMFVVASVVKPGFSSNRTDRILAACRHNNIPVTLILNKIDLDKKETTADLVSTYKQSEVPILTTSAVDKKGRAAQLDGLREALLGKTSAFYGASGVGKSTLLNALEPTLNIKVGNISAYWTTGKHTTSYSQMHRLILDAPEVESWVIDTPGIRVFRPYGVSAGRLRELFPDLARFQRQCYFPNCSHDHEPDCAVYDALERGEVAITRYASYMEMLDELRGAPEEDDGPPE